MMSLSSANPGPARTEAAFGRLPAPPAPGRTARRSWDSAERVLQTAVRRRPGLWLGGALAMGAIFGLAVVPQGEARSERRWRAWRALRKLGDLPCEGG